jgi:hypothetical protein
MELEEVRIRSPRVHRQQLKAMPKWSLLCNILTCLCAMLCALQRMPYALHRPCQERAQVEERLRRWPLQRLQAEGLVLTGPQAHSSPRAQRRRLSHARSSAAARPFLLTAFSRHRPGGGAARLVPRQSRHAAHLRRRRRAALSPLRVRRPREPHRPPSIHTHGTAATCRRSAGPAALHKSPALGPHSSRARARARNATWHVGRAGAARWSRSAGGTRWRSAAG